DAAAEQIVRKWRKAVHGRGWETPRTAALTSTSSEGGISGRVEEWVTPSGDYRARVTREFDDTDVVIKDGAGLYRDWNGFLRKVEGEELNRMLADVWESRVLAFGPPAGMEKATVSKSEDGKRYLLKSAIPGDTTVTWTVDAATGLPAAYEGAGGGSGIATTDADRRGLGGVLAPASARGARTQQPRHT